MTKWQQEAADLYNGLSNRELLDTVLILAQGDDYDGLFTKRGKWEFDYAQKVLYERLSQWLSESNSL